MRWSATEVARLKHLYPTKTIAELAKLLNRTPASIKSKAIELGLKNSPEEIKAKVKLHSCKRTQFKKGNVPHNTKHNGYERINADGYVEVRIKKGKFALKQRLVWEDANGPIPKSHIVVFKDGNKQNCRIDNLELITRAENMIRNSVHNYPEELVPSLTYVARINNKLKQLEK